MAAIDAPINRNDAVTPLTRRDGELDREKEHPTPSAH
jgi:hypothetical protein